MRFIMHLLINIKAVFIAITCLLLSCNLLAQTKPNTSLSVYVKEKGISLFYTEPVRLAKLLADAKLSLSYSPYQLASTLIDPSQQENIQQKKQTILTALSKINSAEAKRLHKQIDNLSFAAKINIDLDPDIVRTFPKKNPLLSGMYVLSLPQRPNHIMILGSTQSLPLYTDIQPGNSLTDYLRDIVFSPESDRSFPWVIQADQTVHQVYDVYWKSDKTFLSPGAIIFIGLRNLPTELHQLNQQIAQLLAYHVEK